MPKDEFQKYIESSEFRELLQAYEDAAAHGTSVYMEPEDIIDIAEYYHMNGAFDKAEEAADYCLDLYPDEDPALLFKARMALIDNDDPETARQLYDRVQEKEDNIDAIYLKAELLFIDSREQECDDYLKRKFREYQEAANNYDDLDEEPDDINFAIDVAAFYIDHDAPDLADEWIKRTDIPTGGYLIEYWEVKAHIAMAHEDYEEAIVLWNKVLDINAYSIPSWLQLCDAHFRLSHFNDAMQCAEYIMAINSSIPDAHLAMGNCLYALNKQEEAKAYFEKYLEYCPEEPTAELLLGTILCNQNNNEEGYGHLMAMRKNMMLMPEQNQREALRICASAAARLGNYDEAMGYCDAMAELGMSESEIGIIRGAVSLESNNLKEALTHFGNALQNSNYDISAMVQVSAIFYEFGIIPAAWKLMGPLIEGLEDEPELINECPPETFALYAALCHHMQKPDDFKKYARMAIAHSPMDAAVFLADFFPEGKDPSEWLKDDKQP